MQLFTDVKDLDAWLSEIVDTVSEHLQLCKYIFIYCISNWIFLDPKAIQDVGEFVSSSD